MFSSLLYIYIDIYIAIYILYVDIIIIISFFTLNF